MFHGTILKNIAWGDPVPDRQCALEAAQRAHAWEFIALLPEQFDIVIGERGATLSAGQRQRIAIARALYRNPRLLILDEATSALDGESEEAIQQKLQSLRGKLAMLIVAHRLKTVAMAERIYVMDTGCIVESGDWTSLMEQNGKFASLVRCQALLSEESGSMKVKQRRLMFVISTLSSGGAERVISELANMFNGKYHVGLLTLASRKPDHYVLNPGVERISLDLMGDSASIWQGVHNNLMRIWMIRRAINRFKPDVVVSFLAQTNVCVLAALFGTSIPVIVSERTDPRRHYVSRRWDVARRLLYPFAAHLVVQTEGVAEWARSFVPCERVAAIPNFVRSLPYTHVEHRSCNALLAVGRLTFEKGFDILIRAFAVSGLSAQGVTLTILGEGPERTALTHLAASLGVGDAVLLPGLVSDPERWMAQAAIFVLPSRYEGFPNVLLEAMAMGCAVIAADCDSGPRNIVRHGTDGILVPPEDVDALADALVSLIGNRERRECLGKAAMEVRNRFAHERIFEQWQNLIEGVIDARRKKRLRKGSVLPSEPTGLDFWKG